MSEAIKIFAFHEAPEDLQLLSGAGENKEWIILIPQDFLIRNQNTVPGFLEDFLLVEEHVVERAGKKLLVLIVGH